MWCVTKKHVNCESFRDKEILIFAGGSGVKCPNLDSKDDRENLNVFLTQLWTHLH